MFLKNLTLTLLLLSAWLGADTDIPSIAVTIKSGYNTLSLAATSKLGYGLVIKSQDTIYNSHKIGRPLMIMVDGVESYGIYNRFYQLADGIACSGIMLAGKGSQFEFTDTYRPIANSGFWLERTVEVKTALQIDKSFNSLFGLQISRSDIITDHDYFVPGIWYKNNFDIKMPGVLAADPRDQYFIFREDRLPLPLVMARHKGNGSVVSLLHYKALPATIAADRGPDSITDERLLTGSLGVGCENSTSLLFMFPGSEGQKNHLTSGPRQNSWANRSHPVRKGLKQQYHLILDFGQTTDYAQAVSASWRRAFDLYQPPVYQVPLKQIYSGLLNTLDYYYTPADKAGTGYDVPGLPFSVFLPEGKVRAYNYQSGFIGRQTANAASWLWQALADNNTQGIDRASAILDFWADSSLLPSGLPRTWYDPANGTEAAGAWRIADNNSGGSALRVACGGMGSLLQAWQFMKQKDNAKPQWLEACTRFGDWLCDNQNNDGSYFLAYNHQLNNNRHIPTNTSKFTTTCAITYLAELYRATSQEKYKNAALKAANFAWTNIHLPYNYIGCVIDNPNVIDRESGQEALYAFIALYDLTGEERWLAAAIQAAEYTITWSYCYEVPAELDAPATHFPANKSIIGQTIIATGHSAADLGLAFSAYHYYRLYLLTNDKYYLHITRLLLHNTKQSMNWDGKLYPGKPTGLQLEAFSITVPRRLGVMQCLSWNYAAHLEPLTRFLQTYGTFDLNTLEKSPITPNNPAQSPQ
ncbi:MAG: hypothetical protein JXM68_13965 [Sedimentisphaerales bacterium]|nr:hypothetical protein [Sedimentisphaerales bacterium]